MKLIVGLGNPGKEYDNTRHNIGFKALDILEKYYGFQFTNGKFSTVIGEKLLNGEKVLFLKPQNYINLSGDVIKKVMDFYKIPVENLLIIVDDMDLDTGKIKIKYKGSSAGHNGLKNIENNLGTVVYNRIKIGISRNKLIDTKDYVLGRISKEEMESLEPTLKKVPNIIDDYLNMSFENLMNKYN